MPRALSVLVFVCLLAACGQQNEPAAVQTPVSAPPGAEDVRLIEDTNELIRIASALDDAVDRKDWQEARQYFADQVAVDFSSLGGRPGQTTADQLVANWQATLPEGKPTFHMRGSPIVRLEGDTGTLTSQGYTFNRLPSRPAGADLWEVWGTYEHRFARTAQGWRVTGMKFLKSYERGDPAIRLALPPAQPPSGPPQ